MDTAAWSSLPLQLLLSVSTFEASVSLSDKQYTDPSGLGALARFAKLDCPWGRFFFALLDLWLRTGMVWVYQGGRAEGHMKLHYNLRVFIVM